MTGRALARCALLPAALLVAVVLADVVVAYALHVRDLLVSGRRPSRPDQPGRW